MKNENRKGLTDFERAKEIVETAKQAAEILSSKSEDKPKPRGHKPKYGVARQEVAAAIDVAETTLIESEQHVETATEIPFLQKPGWRQSPGRGEKR